MMPELEEEIDGREKIEFSSPSRLKRLLAFGMDFVLLTLCSTLLLFYIPKFHGEEAIIEFERLSEQLSGSFSSNQSEASDVENLMIQFSDFTERMNYELWTTLFFISYFLVGEIAFNGKSIGKSAFYLQTRSVSTKVSVSRTQLLLRSLLKGLSCSFFLLGLANLLFFIFNRNKLSLHDFASKTTTIQN